MAESTGEGKEKEVALSFDLIKEQLAIYSKNNWLLPEWQQPIVGEVKS